MSEQSLIDMINQIAADMGLMPTKHRNSFLWWRIPKGWQGTKYAFGYTPWRTAFNGKKGFFACKYRILRNSNMKLVKTVRFGRRKVAKDRSLEWHRQYYERDA